MLNPARSLADIAGYLSRKIGRGGGTNIPGRVLLRFEPDAMAHLGADLRRGSMTVSATNGKTTTARLIAAVLDAAAIPTVANTAGANLVPGVTSALLAGRHQKPTPEIGLFEVDEAALPAVNAQLHPQAMVLMNLFRDQLDRFGEMDSLVTMWKKMVDGLDPAVTLVANADDPAIVSICEDHDNVIWFGLEDPNTLRPEVSGVVDSSRCRHCNEELVYTAHSIAHFGHWRCPNGDSARPTPNVAIDKVDVQSLNKQHVTFTTPQGPITATIALPGLHNIYNAAAAIGAVMPLSLDDDTIATGLGAAHAAFGRGEMVTIEDHDVWLMLAKNPAGVNENIRTIVGAAPEPVDVMAMLNDRTADGRDVSWIWDVDYEVLNDHVRNLTLAGDRAYDLALRFRYGGFDANKLTVVPDPANALDAALAATEPGAPLYVLPTYTAMLDLRAVLTERGYTEEFWENK